MIASSSVFQIAKAGVIDSESVLLDEAGATLLEGWLGNGDLDWDSIWYGSQGATSLDWHASVDGLSNTISIYNISYEGNTYVVGGYNAKPWDSASNIVYDEADDNFVFNLTTGKYFKTDSPQAGCKGIQTVNRFDHFATFGCGFDLHGGTFVLSDPSDVNEGFYSSAGGGKYLEGGNILTDVPETISTRARVLALETFTFDTAQFVAPTSASAPSTIALFALGFLGIAACRFKK